LKHMGSREHFFKYPGLFNNLILRRSPNVIFLDCPNIEEEFGHIDVSPKKEGRIKKIYAVTFNP
jgi:hypothetical protein